MDALQAVRVDFEQRSRRSLSLPLAGAAVWGALAVAGLVLPPRAAVLAMLFGTGAIFPLALLIARSRAEQLLSNDNPFARLMGACVYMVNLLWAVHIPLFLQAPQFVPLTLGIASGLHWVVYSWIVRHPLGYVHATLRALVVLAAWCLFPDHRVTACAAAVLLTYLVSIVQMATRPVSTVEV